VILLTIFLTLVIITLTTLLVIAAKRMLQLQSSLQVLDDSIEMLVRYCKKLREHALISDAPEVVKFHKLVMEVSNLMKKEVKVEEEITNG